MRTMEATVGGFDGESGALLVRMPRACVAEAPRSGPCDDHVAAWLDRVEWVADRGALERYLRGFGAWDDLAMVDLETLRGRALWCAIGDANEPH